jgi:hypothetical protein
MSITVVPLVDEPVLIVENEMRVLVIADLHLGIERELYRYGINIPSQTDKILNSVIDQIKRTNPDRVVLLGDIKHNVPLTSKQERGEIPRFLECLSEHLPVEIVPGNHDGGIGMLTPTSISLHQSTGFILDGVGYFHGHAWPSPELFSASHMVMAHEHPIIRLKDEMGYIMTKQAWIRTKFDRDKIFSHYNLKSWKNPSLTIVPAFNGLCGGIPFNDEDPKLLGPMSKAIRIDDGEVHLIDGTYIGNLKTIKISFINRRL